MTNIIINGQKLTELPPNLPEFVKGDFNAYYNLLSNLDGSPKKVKGDFYCSQNNLTTLVGGPEKVKSFYCFENKLRSLIGAPNCNEIFDCHNNLLTSLEGAPQKINYFIAYKNKLKNLVGSPQIVISNFSCSDNLLTSLLGAPKYVGGELSCKRNNKLTNVSDIWNSEIRSVFITYNEQLAMLPLIKFWEVDFYDFETQYDNIGAKIMDIIRKFRGKNSTGKVQIIECQYELMEAGFENNARWTPV